MQNCIKHSLSSLQPRWLPDCPVKRAKILAISICIVLFLTSYSESGEEKTAPDSSPIEESFTAALGETTVKVEQFGYSLFSQSSAGFVSSTDIPASPGYLLGAGDEIVVHLSNMVEEEYRRRIDRDGNIFLPKIGKLTLGAKTFADAEKLVKEKIAGYYKNVRVSVSLGAIKSVRVFVVGEVEKPGSYQISSLSSPLQLLYLAGGVTKTGSLRNIRVMRRNKQIASLDLYPFLLSGESGQDIRLASGDTVFVPPIGKVAAITGNVKRPAIYELKGEISLEDLINMAGGLMPYAYLSRLQIIRVEDFKKRILFDMELGSADERQLEETPVKGDDLVRILSIDREIRNFVSLEGLVKHPGEYELKPAMKLSDLLNPEELLPEASLEQGEVVRTGKNGKTEIIEFSPEELFKGSQNEDVLLQQRDRVVVRSAWKETWKVLVTGEIVMPGQYVISSGEKLSSVLRRAGGYTSRAFLRGTVFTRKTVQEKELQNLNEFVRNTRALLTKQEQGADPDEKSLIDEGKTLLDELSKKTPPGRIVLHLADPEKLKNSDSDLVLEDGDMVYIPKHPEVVSVLGEVNNPGTTIYQKGKSLKYYVDKVGGFTRNADKKYTYIIKPDGTATGRSSFISEGDAIIVPQRVRTRTGKIVKDVIDMLLAAGLIAAAL